MSNEFDQWTHDYDYYSYFGNPTADEISHRKQVNLRMKVGGETVESETNPVDGVNY